MPNLSAHPSRTPSRPADLRQGNTRGLLELLRAKSPCSRADLARLSGLSAPTVSSSISVLEGLGLIQSVGEGASSGGRPPGLLRFNAERGYVAAADIGGTSLRMMIADLNGTPVAYRSVVFTARQRTPAAVCRAIHAGLKAMCRARRIPFDRILHLTGGAPGITDATTGVVLAAPNLDGWNEVPLRELLESELGIPCLVENDTNLAAVGEHWRGAAQGIDTFAFIALGTGVGAGLFVGGHLHRGAQWSAGEVGYFGLAGRRREPVDPKQTGQLEQAIGGAGIVAEWRRVAGKRARAGAPSAPVAPNATQIFDLALEGDPDARRVLRYTAAMLANAVADIALLLNPEIVVLGGGVGSHPELCRATEKLLGSSTLNQPQLRTSILGTQAQLYGALSISLAASVEQLIA